jgi:hypothetical protein
MQYSFVSAAFLALASSVMAQTTDFDSINVPTPIKAGTTVTVTWTNPTKYDNETVSITLLQGATQGSLQPGAVIAASVDNSAHKFDWKVASDIPVFALYGLKFVSTADSTIFQFSNPFTIEGLGLSSSGYPTATGASTTTVHIATNPTYSPTPKPSTNSSTSVASSTSTYSSYSASTNGTATVTTTASPKPSNGTLSITTTIKPTTSAASTTTTTSAIATQSTNAAVANLAKGSVAMLGGLMFAFAL